MNNKDDKTTMGTIENKTTRTTRATGAALAALALTALLTLGAASCRKAGPEEQEPAGEVPAATADRAEAVLLACAENSYRVWEYVHDAKGHTFTFHEPTVIASLKDEYPEGVKELTLPESIVVYVQETQDDGHRYSVYLKSGKLVTLDRVLEFRTTLAARIDTTVFRGLPFYIPFEVTSSNGDAPRVSDREADGAELEVTLHGNGGTIRVTPTAERGSVSVTITNGLLEQGTEIGFDTYYISVSGMPEWYGNGNEFRFELAVDSNLPAGEIRVESDPWIETATGDGRIAVTLAPNATDADRTGTIAVGESTGLMEPVTVRVTQEPVLVNRPGAVQFRDRAFKAAALAVADTDRDGDVSPEEAMAVTDLTMPGKGIRDLTGIDAFRNVRKLDVSGNHLRELDLSDPGCFANLKDVNIKGNADLESVNLSGCYCGAGLTGSLQTDFKPSNLDEYVKIYGSPKYYESTDFSHNGIHLIQKHSTGKGITIVFLTTDYYDVDYASGAVREVLEYEIEQLFSAEPFTSMRECFDIHYFAAIRPSTTEKGREDDSFQGFIRNTLNKTDGRLAIKIITNSDKDRARASLMQNVGFGPVESTVWLTRRRHVNFGITDFPPHVITHEFGHAIGGLEDQYLEDRHHVNAPNYTTDKDNLPWQRFLELPEYRDRITLYYGNSGYYPSVNSIMGYTLNGENGDCFDSPSRFAIYHNIRWFSDDILSWPGKEQIWQDFLEYDRINADLPI